MNIYQFDEWLRNLVYPRDVDDFIEVLYDGEQGMENGFERRKLINLYTDHYKYFIIAIEREPGKSYLGCQVTARKPRAGEDWSRGNDLPDGPLTTETLEQIKNAIIAYEMVELSTRQPNRPLEMLNDEE